MIFIPPLEIASKIMTLIQDADKEVIIVSPYVDLSKWDKMRKCLQKAVERGLKITFIARRNAKQDMSFLTSIGIHPILIDDLHAKVYINDDYGIVTSLNLLLYSDINSIDIAYKTEAKHERKELVDFVNRYIVDVKKIAKEQSNKITQNITEKTIFFNEYQVGKILDAFENKFWDAKFNATATYVFGSGLFPFGDAMFDSRLTIRISKSRSDFNDIIQYLETLHFEDYHEFKVELNLKSKNSYHYLDFVPTRPIKLQELVTDYLHVVKTILKSDIRKVLKKQQNTW
ncbi:hypothetical protein FMM05_05100 [Flavobacterium zepuense]|uniref:PLD-like domain-containing protein n=1 Tax=Flavobacterium zepuense TaxID=2593302 RepID=A0A552V8E9_9FLAO|nr:hypothetical protein [Flavobacterium zepuense]TRW26756.1 hypothetical protein FMM05_05100 [Flavobacterium zepuense]